MSALSLTAVLGPGLLQGSLVALPRPAALAQLRRLRSPEWAAALPASILIGTFAPLWERPLATALVVLAAVVTPLLALLAAAHVARGRRHLLIAALVLALPYGPRALRVAAQEEATERSPSHERSRT